jgi:hypothetical protein
MLGNEENSEEDENHMAGSQPADLISDHPTRLDDTF